jgi:catechol 2,3-dioxygenase-like lactoylglutathione lyase family enzyme
MAGRWGLTIDCADPARLAGFWARALDYEPAPPPTGYATWQEWYEEFQIPPEEQCLDTIYDPAGHGPRLWFQQVPEPKAGKNRLHIDVQVGGGRRAPYDERWARVSAMVDRLTAAGGTVLRVDDWNGRPDHVVMADPEGNEFCVV